MDQKNAGVNGEAASGSGPYRVMVVDDSAVVRGLLVRTLESDPQIEVVLSVPNGKIAVESLARHDVEIVILDIEMPVMDGLTALPKLIEANPEIRVIMASTLTLRNADISMKALELGACDYIPKPTTREITAGFDFKKELVGKVQAHGQAKRGDRVRQEPPSATDRRVSPAPSIYADKEIELRNIPTAFTPWVLAIGSSTGGPQALFKFFADIKKDFDLPILITQHMPATFTTILAEHLGRISGRPSSEGKEGEQVLPGHIYLAPGGYHMIVKKTDGNPVIHLNQDSPVNFCRPAVDTMFESIAKVYGSHILSVILTGMGSDGAKGAQKIVDSGGVVVAQDEKSSVVWGMPGTAAIRGICSAVLSISEMGTYVNGIVPRPAA